MKTTDKGWQCAEYAAMVLGFSVDDATPGMVVELLLLSDALHGK